MELAVIAIVAKGSARAPAVGVGDSSLGGDVRESAIVVVVIKSRTMKTRDVDVFPSLVVEVPDRNAVTPAAKIQTRLSRDIGKCSIMLVAIETRPMTFARTIVF